MYPQGPMYASSDQEHFNLEPKMDFKALGHQKADFDDDHIKNSGGSIDSGIGIFGSAGLTRDPRIFKHTPLQHCHRTTSWKKTRQKPIFVFTEPFFVESC